jgi:hypothetical protein
MKIETWAIDRLIFYARNPRKNDAAVDRMCGSIREFGFKTPCLVRSDGEVIDGHLRLKAARKLGIKDIPVILCDEWTPAQVKAFRLMVNRSATWADWGNDLLKLELLDLKTSDYDLALTGFDTKEIDDLILNDVPEEDALPPVPVNPASSVGELWICSSHRVLCGDATDTRADWSEAFALVPSLEVAYVWHASKFTREVLDGLLRIGFVHHQQIIWDKGRAVLTRTHYWFAHEPCWYVRKKNAPW